MYVPLFVQGVLDRSATSSGVIVIPFMFSAVIASVTSGWWVSRSGRYKVVAVVGLAVLAAGLAARLADGRGNRGGEVARNAVVAGLGLGLAMQVLIVAVQNTVALSTMGSATALVHFSRSIGGTLGVTVMGVIAARDLRAKRTSAGRSRSTCRSSSATSCRGDAARIPVRGVRLRSPRSSSSSIGLREEPLRRSLEEAARKIGAVSHDAYPPRGWDHVELWVGNAKQAAYYYEHAFGFRRLAYAGPETGIRDRASYVLRQGEVTLVLTNGLSAEHEARASPAPTATASATSRSGFRDAGRRTRSRSSAAPAASASPSGSRTTTAGSRSPRSRPTATSSTRSSPRATTRGRSCPGTRRWRQTDATAGSA